MRKGAVCFLIFNLMILSSWEGLSIVHTLLHKIPNPFHSHLSYPVYHHHHQGHNHDHHHGPSHSLSDHLEKDDIAKGDTLPVSGNSRDGKLLKEFFKINWKLEEERNLVSLRYSTDFLPDYSFLISTGSTYNFKPPVPPPRVS